MSSQEYLKSIGAILIPNVGGILASRSVTKENLDNWYDKLNFPKYRPPRWIFAPVWTSLFTSMGYASYLVWRDGGGLNGTAKLPLVFYGAQLALNWSWSTIFFGHHNIKGGLYDLIALTTTSAACGVMFYKVNKVAGYLFIPYLAWLAFATFLNYSLVNLNPEDRSIKKK